MLLNVMQQNIESFSANVEIKLLRDNAKIPTRGSERAGGYDLYAAIDKPVTVQPHTTEKIGTGISMALPNDTIGAIFARSGLATKKGLRPANCVGVCDADYRGEYIVALHNDSDIEQTIEPGERIAQLIILPFYPVIFNEVEELTETDRGDGGFGSTGAN
jgi:dUTP pyrophosphatase